MKKIFKIMFKHINYFIMVLSLIPIWGIALFDHPSADDFGYSELVHNVVYNGGSAISVVQAAFQTSMHYMQIWQGLYSAAFLLALQPSVFGEKWYALTAFIVLGMLIIGIACLVNAISVDLFKTRSKEKNVISLLIIFYIIQCMPNPVEGIYWFNGAINYIFFLGIAMVLFALMIHYFCNKNALPSIVIASVLAFLISGGNHIVSFICLLIETGFFVTAIIKKKKYLIVLPLITGTIGFIIMYTAPGTAIRAAKDGHKVSLIKTILSCGYQAMISEKTFTGLSTLLILALITPLIVKLIRKSEANVSFTFKGLVIACILDFVIISAMYCVPYSVMGVFGEGRVTDTVYCVYSILIFLTYGYLIGMLINSEAYKPLCEIVGILKTLCVKIPIWNILSFMAVMYIAIAGGTNKYSTGTEALAEIASGDAAQYNLEYNARIDKLNNPEQQEIVFEPFNVQPQLIYFSDLGKNPAVWPNTSEEKYYNKEKLSVKEKANESNQ